MSDEAIQRKIKDYLEKLRRKMPDTFETDDLLEDLEAHIKEAYQNKSLMNPEDDKIMLIEQVLDDVGEPEFIAEEFDKATISEDESEDKINQIFRTTMRYLFTGIIIIAAAWFVASLPDSIIDFWTALIVLFVFVAAESLLRNWERGESKRIETEIKK